MKAARLLEGNNSVVIEDIADIDVRSGTVLVKVQANLITSYLGSLVDGSAGFTTPPRPFTPGSEAVGVIEAVGVDVSGVEPGTTVFCDSLIETIVGGRRRDAAFSGCFPVTGDGMGLYDQWSDGTLATHVLMPAENVTSIEPALQKSSLENLTRLGWLGTAYSAFSKSGFTPGDRVAVTGATGILGTCAIQLALAMGASSVLAIGRNEEKLTSLAGIDSRIEISTSAAQPDRGLDLLVSCQSTGGTAWIEESIPAMRQNGSVVILASLNPAPHASGLVTNDLSIQGSFWFTKDTIGRLVDMIAAGTLSLEPVISETYKLEDTNDALEKAATNLPVFHQIVVCPNM